MENQAPYDVSPEESQEALEMLGKGYRIAGREATIFRVIKNKDNPYVMIDRRPITSPELSFKAKGILTYILSRPDGWEVNVPDLINHSTDGAAAIRTGLKELRDVRHIRYNPTRQGGYIKKWVIEVYEIPYDLPMPEIDRADGEAVLDSDFLQVGNLQVGNLQVGNRGEVLKNLSNTESNREIDAEIFKALEAVTGGLNSDTPRLVDVWKEKHPFEKIMEAIALAASKGRKPVQYIDAILVGWEANGYPKSREQIVNERKGGKAKKSDQKALEDEDKYDYAALREQAKKELIP